MFVTLIHVRFDGMEQLGQVVGTILSPLIFNALGYYGIYVGRLILMVASLVYMIWAVREPIEDRVMKSVTGGVRADSLKDVLSWWRVPVNFTKTYIIIPFRQVFQVQCARIQWTTPCNACVFCKDVGDGHQEASEEPEDAPPAPAGHIRSLPVRPRGEGPILLVSQQGCAEDKCSEPLSKLAYFFSRSSKALRELKMQS